MKNKPYPLYEVADLFTLRQMIDYVTEKYENCNAYRIPKGKDNEIFKTFREFSDDISAFGTSILQKELKESKIAILGENSYEWIVSYFSIVNSGNIAVPLDKEFPFSDLLNLVKDSECKCIIYSSVYSDYIEKFKSSETDIEHYICIDDINELISEGKKLIADGCDSFTNYTIEPDKLAAIVYTSGTTGKSKGVMLTHKNIATDAVSTCRSACGQGRGVLVLPLHHTFGMLANVMAPLLYNGCLYVSTSIRNVQKDMQKVKSTAAILVPVIVETIYKKIWESAEKKGSADKLRKGIKISNFLMKFGIDVRRKLFKEVLDAFGGNIELIICGGASLSPTITYTLRSMGIEVINGYGITECSPVVSVNRNKYNKVGSVGQAIDCNSVRIDNPDSKGIGELQVKGSNVMVGYYGDEQATSNAFTSDGWFRTGDLGYIDADGFIFITGRIKNLIILSNGKNVSPEELEDKILEIPYVNEVVVYEENERITAELFLDSSLPDSEKKINEDINALNRTLPSYKKIGLTKIRKTEFPKTTSMKIKRNYKKSEEKK